MGVKLAKGGVGIVEDKGRRLWKTL